MLDAILAAVKKAGDIIISVNSDYQIDMKKNEKDYVTEFDVYTQDVLVAELKKILPEANYLCEETPESHSADISHGWWFVIDPIDGTTNFIKGYKYSAVSVALCENGEPYIGVVFNPFTDEMFYAVRGNGAYLNGQRISTDICGIDGGIGLFGTSPTAPELREKTFAAASMIYEKMWDVRRTGSAALDLCYIAAGRAVIYIEYLLYAWDITAGKLIAEEAGAFVTKADGSTLGVESRISVLAGNPKAHAQFLAELQKRGLDKV